LHSVVTPAHNAAMFLRRHTKLIDGADYSYWSLVKTVRTPKGPRHQTVAHLGKLDADEVNSLNGWSDLDALLEFGRVYLALALWRRLGLDKLLRKLMPADAEDVGWDLVACVLTIARFCEQPSELGVAERWYADTALKDLLGVAEEKANDARMYRGAGRDVEAEGGVVGAFVGALSKLVWDTV
jgi:hypothetical protein